MVDRTVAARENTPEITILPPTQQMVRITISISEFFIQPSFG
jgi:hypothetical protein